MRTWTVTGHTYNPAEGHVQDLKALDKGLQVRVSAFVWLSLMAGVFVCLPLVAGVTETLDKGLHKCACACVCIFAVEYRVRTGLHPALGGSMLVCSCGQSAY